MVFAILNVFVYVYAESLLSVPSIALSILSIVTSYVNSKCRALSSSCNI